MQEVINDLIQNGEIERKLKGKEMDFGKRKVVIHTDHPSGLETLVRNHLDERGLLSAFQISASEKRQTLTIDHNEAGHRTALAIAAARAARLRDLAKRFEMKL
jgi:hypothetical protein